MKIHRDKGGFLIELEPGDLPQSAYTHKLRVGERARSGRRGQVVVEISAEAVRILGPHGRLLSHSKSAYMRAHPDHEVWFNACVFDEAGTKVWFGDVDFDLDDAKLQELADRIGLTFVTRESPYRRDGLPEERGNPDEIRCYEPRQAGSEARGKKDGQL